jgi:hypothetical protein
MLSNESVKLGLQLKITSIFLGSVALKEYSRKGYKDISQF